jgi:hypothetical protein
VVLVAQIQVVTHQADQVVQAMVAAHLVVQLIQVRLAVLHQVGQRWARVVRQLVEQRAQLLLLTKTKKPQQTLQSQVLLQMLTGL